MAADAEGSLLDSSGAVRHFGQLAFERLAQDPARCFLCGAPNSRVAFNQEHVVPNWILRRFRIGSLRVTLPNQTRIPYDRYKIRCCSPCNSLLGAEVEVPVSALLSDDVATLRQTLDAPNNCLLYRWLCLLFVKTHLKDRDVRADLDRRNPSPQLSALYEWDRLHHVHSVARAAQSRAAIDPKVQGTILVFDMSDRREPFDYGDIYDHSTIFVRVGRIGVVAVLNDSGAAGMSLSNCLSGVNGRLSDIQLREVAARAAYQNERLLSRPTFYTELHAAGDLFMKSDHPDILRFGPVDNRALGALLEHTCGPRLRRSTTPNQDELLSRLRRAEGTFLYDDEGLFIKNPPGSIIGSRSFPLKGGRGVASTDGHDR